MSVLDRAELLYDHHQIDRSLTQMANQIAHDLPGPLTVIGVMTGALVTMGHLLVKMPQEVTVDYLHISRYKNNLEGSEQLDWLAYPATNLKNKTVLIVDDIFDEGVTLAAAKQYCLDRGASLVKSCVLINKERPRGNVEPDYFAMRVPDRYVFGFGMDYQQLYRNQAGIYSLHLDDQP